MSLTYMNAQLVHTFWSGDPTASDKYNWIELQAPVDVSQGATLYRSDVGGRSASGSNYTQTGVEDGGASGAGTTQIFALPTGTDGETDLTPTSVSATSGASDTDAGDWWNADVVEAGTNTIVGITLQGFLVYGIPGAPN